MQPRPLAAPSAKVRPGRWLYFLAIAILLIGGGLSGLNVYNGVTGLTKGLTRVVIPGSETITLSEPGDFIIFHEYISNHEGRTFNNTAARQAPLTLELIDHASDAPVPIAPSAGSFTYSLSGKKGESIARFSIDQPGRFDLRGGYAGPEGAELVLAIGHEIGKSSALIGLGIAGIIGSGFVAMVLFIITAVMRARSRRRIAQPYQPGPPPYQPGPSMRA